MLPNEKKENRVLLIYGIYTQGSQAAIEFLTSPEKIVPVTQCAGRSLARSQDDSPLFRGSAYHYGRECGPRRRLNRRGTGGATLKDAI